MQYCPERNMYWDPPPDGTEYTATNINCNKGYTSDVTMYYCYLYKRWGYHHAPGHDTWQATQSGASGNLWSCRCCCGFCWERGGFR